jgi:periplasmic protein CpxP/Spy
MSDLDQTAPRKRFFTGRRVAIAGAAALGLAALGITAVSSQPQWGPGGGFGPGHGGQMGHGGGYGMMGGRMFGGGPLARLDDALTSVGATADQKQKIFAIGRQAMTELAPLRDRRFVARTRLQELMKAQTVDRAAIEKLRAEEFAAYEAGSKRAAQALADASEVLNAQQRIALVERFEARRRWWRG